MKTTLFTISLLIISLSADLYATVNNFEIKNISFRQTPLYLGKNAEPHFETTVINTDEDLTFEIEVYRSNDDEKVNHHEFFNPATQINGQTLSTTGLWFPETLDSFYITISVFNEHDKLIKFATSGNYTVGSGTILNDYIRTSLLASFQLSGYDVNTYEDVYSRVQADYKDGYKYLYYFSAEANYYLGAGMRIVFDVSDYLGITPEGQDGWVSTWIEPYLVASLSLPVAYEIGLVKVRTDDELEDKRGDFVSEALSLDFVLGKWGFNASLDNSDGFEFYTDPKGFNIGISYKKSLSFTQEYKRPGFEQLFNSVLLEKDPPTSLSPLYKSSAIYLGYKGAQKTYEIGSLVNNIIDNGYARKMTLDDKGREYDGISTNFPTDLEVIIATSTIDTATAMPFQIHAVYNDHNKVSRSNITDQVTFQSYPSDALTFVNNRVAWKNSKYSQADVVLTYNGKIKKHTFYRKSVIPIAVFKPSISSASVGQKITASSVNTATSYSWRLFRPDGTDSIISTYRDVGFTASDVGSYTLELIINNGDNDSEPYRESIDVKTSYPNKEFVYHNDKEAHIYIDDLDVGECDEVMIGSFTVPAGEKWTKIKFAASRGDLLLAAREGSWPSLRSGYCGAWEYRTEQHDFIKEGAIADWKGDDLMPGDTLYLLATSYAGITDFSINSEVTVSYDLDDDGVPDQEEDSVCLNNKLDSFDSDDDGVCDNADRFANDKAASIDTDEDGHPDYWNTGRSQSDSSTGLTKDLFPLDPMKWSNQDDDNIDPVPEDDRFVNNSPVIELIPIQKVLIGDSVSVSIKATDPENDKITLKVVNLNIDVSSFVTLKGSTLTINGKNQTNKTVTFFVEAKDPHGLKDVKTVSVVFEDPTVAIIYEAPIITAPSNKIVEEGATYTATPSINAKAGSDITWSFDTAAPSGMTIDQTTGVVSWPDPVAGTDSYTIIIKATNSVGSDTKSWTLTVAPLSPNDTVDSDGDGMTDRFERAHDLNPLVNDASLDSDVDGYTNLVEFQNNTDPQDEHSYIETLYLEAGWNMVALPMKTTLSIAEIDDPAIEIIRSYQYGRWYVWTKDARISKEMPLIELVNGLGYWIKTTASTSLTIPGTELSAQSPMITDGKWHMMGSVGISNINTFFEEHPEITTLWKYTDGAWMSVSGKADVRQSMIDANIPAINSVEPREGFMYK